jgi:hypothetical protein
MRMRRITALWAASATLMVLVATAQARSIEYMSQHPLPRKIGHGFCYIDVPHFHDFPPSDPRLYRQVNGQYYFVGDPSPFEYEGPKYPYYGGHPVVEANVNFAGPPVYCHLRGPHYHWYQPPPQAQFELKGGAYWYVGAYPQTYYDEQPRYAVVNDAYAPIVYTRPIVDVTVVPPAFHGEIIAAGPGFRGQAVIGAPVAPSVGVYVAAPPPPVVQVGVGIGVGGPPPPTVIERREVYEVHEHHEHWDNGRHRGWDKHGPPPQQPGGWRGNPAPPPHAANWRGNPAPAGPPPHAANWRGNPAPTPAPQGGGWHGNQGGNSQGGNGQGGNHQGGGGNHQKPAGWHR